MSDKLYLDFFSKDISEQEKLFFRQEYGKLLVIYRYLLGCTCLVYALLDLRRCFYFSLTLNLAISLYAFTSNYLVIKQYIEYKLSTMIYFFTLFSFVLFYFSSHCGFNSGMILLYIPIVFAVIFFINIIKEFKIFAFFILLFLLQIGVNFITDFSLFFSPKYTLEIQKEVLIANIFVVIVNFLLFCYLIYKKELLLLKVYRSQVNQNVTLKNKIQERESAFVDIDKLIPLAESGNASFFVAFSEVYPDFFLMLKNHRPILVLSEIHVCCYIRMNYTSKDIARFTRISVRSVESKKYRIKKKFSLNPDDSLTEYILSMKCIDLEL